MNPNEVFSGHSHSFDTGLASLVGVEASIIFNHIVYWLKINAAKKNAELIEGKYWMYETQKQIADFLGYLTEDQVQRSIKKLLDAGLLIKANFNKNSFDKTNWYTVFDQSIILEHRGNKKMFTKPQNCGIGTADLRNPDRKIADSLYIQQDKHIEETTTNKAAAPAVAVSSKSKPTPALDVLANRLASNPELKKCYEEEKHQLTGNSGQLAFEPVQSKIYPCLMNVDIPQADRVWITKHHQEDVVKNAIEWATHPQTKISTTLVQAIKWACSKKPETPKSPQDVESENKHQAIKLLKQIARQPNYLKIELLNNSIEIIYTGAQKLPEEIKYSEKGFLQQLKSKLYKAGCVFTMN